MPVEERVKDAVRTRLQSLHPCRLQVIDESHMHIGHGAPGAHIRVVIVAESFVGKSLLERHRLVYEAIGDLLPDTIHALGIQAHSPEEEKAAPV